MAPLRKPRCGNDATGSRRANGALETAILNVLWQTGEPLSAAEVRERLAEVPEVGQLAYTTVMTILTRLYEKNALTRERDGRAFRYAPVADEAGLAARRLTEMLETVSDREAVLSQFVSDLSDRDEQLMRAVLDARSAAE